MGAFYEKTYAAMRQHIDFGKIKCVVLASPGFVKDEFLEHCLAESVRQDARDIIEHKSKFLCCHASSGYKHSLQEALADPGVAAQLADTKAAGEVQALADFNTMMGEDPDRAYYGPVHVRKAAEMGAIHTLLILDELFRNTDVVVRQQWVQMTEEVEAAGGRVFVFSSMHLSGTQLKNISGVAALLRFPMPEIVSG
jgi:protein pelota